MMKKLIPLIGVATLCATSLCASGFVGAKAPDTPSTTTPSNPFNPGGQDWEVQTRFVVDWCRPQSAFVATNGYVATRQAAKPQKEAVSLNTTPTLGAAILLSRFLDEDNVAHMDVHFTTRGPQTNGLTDTGATPELVTTQPVGDLVNNTSLLVKTAEASIHRPIDLRVRAFISKSSIQSQSGSFALRSFTGVSGRHLKRLATSTYYKAAAGGDDKHQIVQEEIHLGAGPMAGFQLMKKNGAFRIFSKTIATLHATSVQNISKDVHDVAGTTGETNGLHQKEEKFLVMPGFANETTLEYAPPESNLIFSVGTTHGIDIGNTHTFTNVMQGQKQNMIYTGVHFGLGMTY